MAKWGKLSFIKHIVRISEFFNINIEYLFTNKDSIETFLDKDEKELLMTYNKLDRRGQHRVHTIIYEELDRIAFNKNKKSDAGSFQDTLKPTGCRRM